MYQKKGKLYNMAESRKMVSFRLRKVVMDQVMEHCKRIGQTPTEMADRAIHFYVKELDAGHIHFWSYARGERVRWTFRMKKSTLDLLVDRAGDKMTLSEFLTEALCAYYDYAHDISL